MPRGKRGPGTGKGRGKKPAANGDGNKPMSGTSSGPVLHNVTDDAIKGWALKIIKADHEKKDAKKAYDSKNGFYRQLFKDAGKEGVSAQALSWYMANRERDPAEIDRETKERNRVARVMALPIGTQLGLLEDGATVAGAVDQAKIAEAEGASDLSAHDQGRQAAMQGKGIGTNPFPEGSDEFEEFEQGWGVGLRENAKEYGGGSLGAAAH